MLRSLSDETSRELELLPVTSTCLDDAATPSVRADKNSTACSVLKPMQRGANTVAAVDVRTGGAALLGARQLSGNGARQASSRHGAR